MHFRVERALEIKWLLFNQSCKALIEVLVDAETHQEIKGISAQILGIPTIKQRSFRLVDEEEIRRRVRRATAHSSRKIQTVTEWANVLLYRNKWKLLRAYFTLTIGLTLVLVADNLIGVDFHPWLLPSILSVVSLSIVLFIFPRNPYRELLRNRPRDRQG